jgi:DNA-binding winged helix-turn-helix (wHTH) protein
MLHRIETEATAETPQPIALTYRFGSYMLDVTGRRLLHGSEKRPLPEKVSQILLLLLEANCQVVERRTFFEHLWPDDPCSEANLTQHIFMLRGVLGEHSHDQRYVVTVPGKGYRLAVPVETKLGLTMKGLCERCGLVLLASSEVFICSYECTFCAACAEAFDRRCPNCGGEQVRRPRRTAAQ